MTSHIDYSVHSECPVSFRGMQFTFQFVGVTAADLKRDNFAIVNAAAKRRGIQADLVGEPRDVPLLGHSGRPRRDSRPTPGSRR